jgi:hypothetical protein
MAAAASVLPAAAVLAWKGLLQRLRRSPLLAATAAPAAAAPVPGPAADGVPEG